MVDIFTHQIGKKGKSDYPLCCRAYWEAYAWILCSGKCQFDTYTLLNSFLYSCMCKMMCVQGYLLHYTVKKSCKYSAVEHWLNAFCITRGILCGWERRSKPLHSGDISQAWERELVLYFQRFVTVLSSVWHLTFFTVPVLFISILAHFFLCFVCLFVFCFGCPLFSLQLKLLRFRQMLLALLNT